MGRYPKVNKVTPPIEFHEGDLPAGLDAGVSVAVDSETMGLNPNRDRLCLVQLCFADGQCHLVRFAQGSHDAPNLKALLTDPKVTKIFHFARFDVAMFRKYLGIETAPLYCTKIASKLVRTYTSSHGLKDLCKELVDVDMSKVQQSSDWGADSLSAAQMQYAASDVIHLHALREKLDRMLVREGRAALAQACFTFLPTRVDLDLGGWSEDDIFAH
jgi:ribonuclease D